MPAVSEGPVSDHGGAHRLPGAPDVPDVVRVTTSRGPGNLANFPDSLAGIRSCGDGAKSRESQYGKPGHRRIGAARSMTTGSMPGAFSGHASKSRAAGKAKSRASCCSDEALRTAAPGRTEIRTTADRGRAVTKVAAGDAHRNRRLPAAGPVTHQPAVAPAMAFQAGRKARVPPLLAANMLLGSQFCL